MPSALESRYNNFIRNNKLKSSKRRDLIFDHVIRAQGHITVDQIYQEMLKIDAEIGIATIYRTVRLLVDCGVLVEHTFGEKKGFFEVIDTDSKHHDHLICDTCGKILEFQYDLVEDDKKRIAKQYQFQIKSYKLEIFGTCSQCQKQQ